MYILQNICRYTVIYKVDYQHENIGMPFQNMNNYYRHDKYDLTHEGEKSASL